nr:hypothetical protein Itr_chr12CG10410 [Ipomoea trifida]
MATRLAGSPGSNFPSQSSIRSDSRTPLLICGTKSPAVVPMNGLIFPAPSFPFVPRTPRGAIRAGIRLLCRSLSGA